MKRTFVLLAVFAAGSPVLAQPIFTVNPKGPSGLLGSLIYMNQDGPVPVGGGPGIGAGLPGDDLDGYAPNSSDDDFIICLAVDPATVGSGNPFTLGSGGPGLPQWNVFNQSQRRQHAGDAYLSSEAYNRRRGLLPKPISMGLNNNFLAINQAAPYFANFGLQPPGGPEVQFPAGTPADDVDGVGHLVDGKLPKLYFSLSRESPSLRPLGGVSGADLFFDPDATRGGDEQLFASFDRLGLHAQDDIDGVAVFDLNGNGRFDDLDQVLFSLTRESPSLKAFDASAADVFSIVAGSTTPIIFAKHNEMGLLFSDDVTSIDLIRLINNSAFETILAHTPAPGTLALVALCGISASRRRR